MSLSKLLKDKDFDEVDLLFKKRICKMLNSKNDTAKIHIFNATCSEFAGGLRQFHANLTNVSATLRSRSSLKSEDDLPPPYGSEELTSPSAEQPPLASTGEDAESQQSPPPYHVAISMSEVELHQEDVTDSEDEPDSKVNLTAKRVMAKLTRVVRANK